MVKNCSECTTEEKMMISTRIADSFDRVYDQAKALARTSLIEELRAARALLDMYQTVRWSQSQKPQVDSEIRVLRTKVQILETQLAAIKLTPDSRPASLDPRAEGNFEEVPVSKSEKLMRKSLR
jgi:hypothetical protein